MIQFDLPKEHSSIIKVIGVGGGGSNAVNYMYNQNIDGVDFVICNTDAQALATSYIPNRVQLGPLLTQGLGAGANPEIGRQATEESLDEIKRILEVNTKMVFITAGMGGGTGTGGAPILAKICKDLGILTVGIVTTPFSYEGKKRMLQAKEGIDKLKDYVDTLLVISNDKLRHQFGNLTMKAAFSMADNVLATAAKCITDVIGSTGQINVDFADVCTVMRNGGVAILGSAMEHGEDRAHRAIVNALNSPLLNDSDIRGAKWILINICSAEGEDEFTMDEVDAIQSYLLTRAGEDTDIILGLGYDNNLGQSIGITLIATGFERKDPFDKNSKSATAPKAEDNNQKIMMTLGIDGEESKLSKPISLDSIDENDLSPRLSGNENVDVYKKILHEIDPVTGAITLYHDDTIQSRQEEAALKMTIRVKETNAKAINFQKNVSNTNETGSSNNCFQKSGVNLTRPFNIYAENNEENTEEADDALGNGTSSTSNNDTDGGDISHEMHLVIKDSNDHQEEPPVGRSFAYMGPIDDFEPLDEIEIQKRKAAERLNKLRNLSFNLNTTDPNNEFETIPAYVRRNMELRNTPLASVEKFYSNYTVKADDNNVGQISTINTFLDGKKPD
ncbi:MAG: cell division protein FtsZ [Chitinophagaceae bacterium]